MFLFRCLVEVCLFLTLCQEDGACHAGANSVYMGICNTSDPHLLVLNCTDIVYRTQAII